MATQESLVLDGLDLSTGVYSLEAISLPVPKKRAEWAQGADADGSLLVRDPLHENREVTVTVRIVQTTMDLALAAVGAITDKLEEAERQPDGLGMVWTPATGTKSYTLYVLSGEVTDMPVTPESGYFAYAPVVTVALACKPFGYGTGPANLTDAFSSDSIGAGLWAFDAGTGTLSVSGGQLVPSDTTEKRIYRTDRTDYDSQPALKITTGAAVTPSVQIALALRRLDSNNELRPTLVINGASSLLRVQKVDASTVSTLASGSTFTLSAATSYWFRARTEGNTLYLELWTAAPTATGTPAQTFSYTLAGGDATKFGAGIKGAPGIRINGSPTDYRYDDFTVEPNVYVSSSPTVTGVLYGIAGDVPAEGRLIFVERSGQDRAYAEWGLESRWLDTTTSLDILAGSLVTSGFAGTATTRTGAYS